MVCSQRHQIHLRDDFERRSGIERFQFVRAASSAACA